ncbi:hypothetical protein L345_11270, partial [Ophiophagus hannah]
MDNNHSDEPVVYEQHPTWGLKPLERSSEDVDIIFTRLKEVKAFEKFHPNLLQQICLCGYYENLEKVFRQGDIGTNWYAVLTGSLDVKVSDTSNHQYLPVPSLTKELWIAVETVQTPLKHEKTYGTVEGNVKDDAVTICTLGIGTAFGESVLDNTPRHATIVTRENSELLRIEQKDFKALWEKNVFRLCILRRSYQANSRIAFMDSTPSGLFKTDSAREHAYRRPNTHFFPPPSQHVENLTSRQTPAVLPCGNGFASIPRFENGDNINQSSGSHLSRDWLWMDQQ